MGIPLLREMSRSDKGFAVFARKRGTACGGRREKVFFLSHFVFKENHNYWQLWEMLIIVYSAFSKMTIGLFIITKTDYQNVA